MHTGTNPADIPILRGRLVLLRRVEERDKEDRLAAGQDAEAVRMYGGNSPDLRPFTSDDAERWYQFHRRELLTWVAEVDGRCIGGARLHGLDTGARRARFAIGIFDPSLRDRGIGTEMTRLVLRHAFETLRLHRVDLRVLGYNHRAIACYAKCGFVREGVERETALVDGEWHGDVIMSILEHEYRELAVAWT
jgi:[ribosomal protein S5]-alanine N-acetyltransferase